MYWALEDDMGIVTVEQAILHMPKKNQIKPSPKKITLYVMNYFKKFNFQFSSADSLDLHC